MNTTPLSSLNTYSEFVASLLSRTTVQKSTVRVWSVSRYTGIAEGKVLFSNGCQLRMRELLDFDAELIVSYGYEVIRGEERLYWYDDTEHPNDPSLAPTFPHHKHVPPNIKHNRIPAPEISFERANLPFIVAEIEGLS
ncbi:MAG: DUF6516 family protein [Acidobacteriota bacterium]|nr:DUF6516 family protein [Acidobacteriota bacterium]